MLQKETIQFLAGIAKNNKKQWFEKHKDDYKAAKADCEMLAADLITRISAFEPRYMHVSPPETMFRIYRDVRFSKDKTPYKTHIGIVIGPRGRKSTDACYYLHIQPGNNFIIAGHYSPSSQQLANIRGAIVNNASELRALLKKKSVKDNFGALHGEQLKTAPRGYEKDHPEIDLLRYKQFMLMAHLPDSLMTSKDLSKTVISLFKKMKPLNDYLNTVAGP